MAKNKAHKRKPRERYVKNYLDKVMVRLDFSSALRGVDTSVPTRIAKHVTASFPIKDPAQSIYAGEVKFGEGTVNAQSKSVGKEWRFHGSDRKKTVSIASQWTWIEYSEYRTVEVLQEDFLGLVEILFEEYGNEIAINRFGMRYINKITAGTEDPSNWGNYINSKLLGSIGMADDESNISRVFNVLAFNYGDMNMTFQFGIFNPDYPAPIRRREFTLDFDAYSQGCLEKDDIKRYFDTFHDKIEESFEECITDGLRRTMR
jgi:uncharacterized protein (TIGR04255 family)